MENLIEAEDIAIKDYITNIKNKILTTEQLIDMQISTKINLKDSCMTDLKYYLYLENTLLEDIDKSENLNITQKKLLRKQVYYLLKENFTHNERRETIRNNFISQIDLYLYSSIIPNIIEQTDIHILITKGSFSFYYIFSVHYLLGPITLLAYSSEVGARL